MGQAKQVLIANLKSFVSNYLDAGISKFLFAWSIRSKQDLETLKSVTPFPLKVVGLTAPLEVIKERLSKDVTTGRHEDLDNTERWLLELLVRFESNSAHLIEPILNFTRRVDSSVRL